MHRLLFVYGTLKQGHPRCKHLSGQRYLGTARTSQSYSMYKVSNSFPGLVEAFTSHPAQRIYGEMYEVDGDCLDILDDIEGVSEGMYKRMDIMVEDMNLSNLPIFSDNVLLWIDFIFWFSSTNLDIARYMMEKTSRDKQTITDMMISMFNP